ncbi:MAG: phosphoesterase [Gammaproteobacteria bacterium]|nr:phosphoesterase [Gammaproteobacteria bacterium]
MTRTKPTLFFTGALVVLTACATPDSRWLAGDHHIHSRYSVGWDREQNPPAPIIAGDAVYPTPVNAAMAKKFGLSWMVTTDHGGPNHSKVNRDVAYPELLESRAEVAEVIQFYGMELNTPAGDHSSLIIPHSADEADVLFRLESSFDKYDAFPLDPSRDTEDKMIAALEVMRALEKPPVVIANHPSRSASGYGEYGLYDPTEFRRWNDTAPDVAVGMAGAPGHQAMSIAVSITDELRRVRGAYGRFPTMGGFDQMTAKLGGFWDSMLGEGRRWWITANSDSHVNYTQGGVDFWPGEYSKTYVYAEKNYDSILSALRGGKVFVTTGDLVSELFVEVTQENRTAAIGDEITVEPGSEITVKIRIRDPNTENAAEENPQVRRVDLIVGDVTGPVEDRAANSNESTSIVERYTSLTWKREGEYLLMSHTLAVPGPMYVRVRGTNTDELEPKQDPPAENPWGDLWFYSNPIFIKTR